MKNIKKFKNFSTLFLVFMFCTFTSQASKLASAQLEITLKISDENRPAAVEVFKKYKKPFLKQIKGARNKNLLIRSEDVQVLHGFKSIEDANEYLNTDLFMQDVVRELKPLLEAAPEIRIYTRF